MLGYKPNHKIWTRINAAILNENAAEVLATCIGGMCSLLISAGVVANHRQARVHLAAVLLSPDTAPKPGSLLPELPAELARLDDGGKWIT
jgi:hypothetical protein